MPGALSPESTLATHTQSTTIQVIYDYNDPSDIRYHGKSMAWYKTQQWDAQSKLMAAFDPEPIPDYGQRVEIGRDLSINHPIYKGSTSG